MKPTKKTDKSERKTLRNTQLHTTLREVLVEARVRAGLKQFAVSEAIGRPPEFCNKVEHGVRVLSSLELFEYSRAIKTSADVVTAEVERRILLKRKLLR